jgi:hypothetical protein
MADFARHMNNQLAQLPTTGQHAAAQALSIGERCGRHIRFAVPSGAITDNQKVAAINKMINGLETRTRGLLPRGELIVQIKKGLGINPATDAELLISEADKFFITIP